MNRNFDLEFLQDSSNLIDIIKDKIEEKDKDRFENFKNIIDNCLKNLDLFTIHGYILPLDLITFYFYLELKYK